MTKPQTETTEKRIKSLLAKWAPLEQERLAICAKRDTAVKKLREQFDADCAPHNTRANEKLAPVNEKIAPIKSEIEKLLLAAVDEDNIALLKTVESREARAETLTKTERHIEPRDLLEAVPEADRTPSFWGCLNVLIGKTEKFLGEKIDDLAKPERKHRVTISLR